MTTHCTSFKLSCQTPGGARPGRIEADFSGGTLTSDAGLLLTWQAARRLDLFNRIAGCFEDLRHPELVVHQVDTLAGQRVLALLQGYEDLNDHDELRKDPLLGAVLGCMEPGRSDCEPLAGKSTLNRLELSAGGGCPGKHRKIVADFEALDELLVDLLAESFKTPPSDIVLDLDATDFELHGGQEEKFYHGYYREYCYLPALVFCGSFPVLVRLRTAAKDPAAGMEEELQRLVKRIRRHWPETHITLRTDSGYCREAVMAWCENTDNVDYVIGLARNARLKKRSARARRRSANAAAAAGETVREFCEFGYRTKDSWSRRRRVICKAEALKGEWDETRGCFRCKDNARYIVTSLPRNTHDGKTLYEQFYCARGDAENRVKDLKLDLFAERCSSNLFDANALRLYLSAFAHILFLNLRRALHGTTLAACRPVTVCLRLLKIGARVRISARRVHVAMSSAFPHQRAFIHAWRSLAPG